MAGKKGDKVKSDDIVGFKYFKILAGMLEMLHGAGCGSCGSTTRSYTLRPASGSSRKPPSQCALPAATMPCLRAEKPSLPSVTC
jgi:hypothetical protein